MKRIIKIILLTASIFALFSCGERKKTLLPNVSGKAGEVLIVLGEEQWTGSLGAEIKDTLAADCPFLPQKEPLYTLVNITPNAFGDLFKVHRNIIIFNINNKITEPGVVYRNDVWAKPQTVIAINAIDTESAKELFLEHKIRIATTLEQAERNRVIDNSLKYEERSIRPSIVQVFGGAPHFPTGYSLKKITEDFAWVAYETQYTTQGVFIYKYPAYEGAFERDNAIAKRDEFLQKYVPGMFEDTYMITSEITKPSMKYLKYKHRDFAELRGYWEVHNDFMGGPFVSHLFYSEDGQYIVALDAWVYAPKYDKRHYLRQVESFLYSFEWSSNDEEGEK